MPHQTELDWAKEICRRQGYHVVQASRVHELYARYSIRDYEAEIYAKDPTFKDYIWRRLLYMLVEEIEKLDLILRGDRNTKTDYPTVRVNKDVVLRYEIDEPMGWPGKAFMSRITVIEP